MTKKKSNATMLPELDTRRSLINRIHKCQATFLSQLMKRKTLEHLTATGMVEGKVSMGKHREEMLDRLTKWLDVGQVTDALTGTTD